MLKSFFKVSFLFFFNQALAAEPTLRILCSASDPKVGTMNSLATLRSDVTEEYFTPSIKIYDENNKALKEIIAYQPWKSDGINIHFFVIAKNRQDAINLYSVEASVARREGQGTPVATSREFPENSSVWTDSKDLIHLSQDKLVFAGASEGEFVIYNLIDRSQQILKTQKNLFNPRFSVSSEYLIFDQLDTQKYIVRQIAYNLKTNKVAHHSSNTANDVLFLENNPSDNSWISMSITKDGFGLFNVTNSKGATVTIKKIALHETRFPVVYSYDNSSLSAYWASHSYRSRYDETESFPVGTELVDAAVHQLTFSNGQVLHKFYPYGKTIESVVYNSSVMNTSFMSGGLKAPGSNEIIFSLGIHKGLAKLNLADGQWSIHGSGSMCVAPKWTIEVN